MTQRFEKMAGEAGDSPDTVRRAARRRIPKD
jgi:hypothetical protein